MAISRSLPRCLALALFAAAACTDRLPTAPPAAPDAPLAMEKVRCVASRAAVRCGETEMGGLNGLVLGGQGTLVRLSSSNLAHAGGSFTFSVTVQNLLGQAIGTMDGTTMAPGGVRVFLIDEPAVTAGSGRVTVVPDGVQSFTGISQPYYEYAQVLAPGAVSAPRTWRFELPATVDAFTFSVYVAGPVRYPEGWIQFTSPPGTLPVGGTFALEPTVLDRLGHAVAGQSVTYSSSNPAIAAVNPATGVITAAALGTANITATSGARSAVVPVTVGAAIEYAFFSATGNALVGTTLQTTLTLYDAKFNLLTGRRVVYTSGDPVRATVSATGLVTAIAPGPVVITAAVEGRSLTGTVTVTAPPAGIVRMTQIAAGANHACGLAAGAAYCWGPNADGQLGAGLGTSEYRNVPTAVAGGLTFSSISSGSYGSCALTPAGAAWCWGENASGQVGNGTTADAMQPVAVSGGHTFSAIAASRSHTCAIDGGGAAWCWGENGFGQLGNGGSADASQPVAVAGGHRFVSISSTWDHTCAVDADGAAWCWGTNPWGGLGDGSFTARSTPVAVAGGLTFRSVSAGMSYSCGVTTANTAWCWGDNSFAQLGNGLETSTYSSSVPVPVSGGISWSSISAAGRPGTCGLATSGAVYCWGRNDGLVTLGTGSNIGSSNVPAKVAGGLAFTSLSAGSLSTCGLTTDGFAYCWGAGQTGVLGQGAYANQGTVTPVARGAIP